MFWLQGHVETIFDCKFKPDDPNLLATASFDGTIKVWDINTLTAVYTSPGNEGVVYSLSWAPGKNNAQYYGPVKFQVGFVFCGYSIQENLLFVSLH